MKDPLYKIGEIVGSPARFGDSEEGDIDYNEILYIEWSDKDQTYYYTFNNLEVMYTESEKNLVKLYKL